MHMRKLSLLSAAAAAGILSYGSLAQAQTVLQLGHVGEPGSLFQVVAEEFAEKANERLAEAGHDYEIRVFGSSQLGGDQQMLQRLRGGTQDFSIPSTVLSSTVDEFGLFEMPYLVRDREHMKRIEEEIFWPDLAPLVEENGYKILAVWENGFRHVTNNVRPVERPEDMRDLRLRIPQGAWRAAMFEAYGANPSPMAYSEVFVALQTGVMDGQENPFTQIAGARLQEVQDYLSLTGHVYTPAYLTVGLRKWESHPEEVRQIIEEVARETQAFVYETAERMEAELLEELSADMEVNEVDTDAFIEASQGVYERFDQEVPGGGDLIQRALALGEAS